METDETGPEPKSDKISEPEVGPEVEKSQSEEAKTEEQPDERTPEEPEANGTDGEKEKEPTPKAKGTLFN